MFDKIGGRKFIAFISVLIVFTVADIFRWPVEKGTILTVAGMYLGTNVIQKGIERGQSDGE